MKRILFLGMLGALALPAHAQQPAPNNDQYWQQLVGFTAGQSASQIVSMARQIDDLKAQLAKAQASCPAPPKEPAQ